MTDCSSKRHTLSSHPHCCGDRTEDTEELDSDELVIAGTLSIKTKIGEWSILGHFYNPSAWEDLKFKASYIAT
jgi:hypothetical protein